ncbi:MAG: hypothetical protein ACYTAN_18485 [Planctomycetota bacterium]|jgi:hypothetical protein
MGIVRKSSLAATLDAVNEVYFFGGGRSRVERAEAAKWIASRVGLKGSYELMPAPTKADFEKGVAVFTGERFRSGVGTGCKLGNEALRALILLDAGGREVKDALERAKGAMSRRIAKAGWTGRYCCGSCAVATWRNALVGGLERPQRILAAGVRILKKYRDGKGGWRTFPFWYTLLALSEIDTPAARAEKRHAAPLCERFLERAARRDKFARRRWIIAEGVLARAL